MLSPGLCGRSLDRYHVDAWLGGGGFADVYRAEHLVVKRKVALKVLRSGPRLKDDTVERFFRESQALAACPHPHIAQVYDAGTTPEGHPFMVQELVEGCSLDALLRSSGTLSLARAARIGLQLLDGLQAAHASGVIHRDIKPSNIMLLGTNPDERVGPDVVKIVDFGISKIESQSLALTGSGMIVGSPGFAAPEQCVSARTIDARADLYSVAVVLYRALCGSFPIDADGYQQMIVRVATQSPVPLAVRAPHLAADLCEVIDRGLARDVDARWQSAREFADALQAGIDHLSGTTLPDASLPHGNDTLSLGRVSEPSPSDADAVQSDTLVEEPAVTTDPPDPTPSIHLPMRRHGRALAVVLTVGVLLAGASWAAVRVTSTDGSATPRASTAKRAQAAGDTNRAKDEQRSGGSTDLPTATTEPMATGHREAASVTPPAAEPAAAPSPSPAQSEKGSRVLSGKRTRRTSARSPAGGAEDTAGERATRELRSRRPTVTSGGAPQPTAAPQVGANQAPILE